MPRPIKMLLIGESGTGKTGSLASLLSAGFNVRIIDVDNGVPALLDILTGQGSKYKIDSIDRLSWETLSEKMRITGEGRIVPASANVWPRAMKLLEEWKGTEKKKEDFPSLPKTIPAVNLGTLTSWGSNDVLVIDSLSTLAKAAKNFHLAFQSGLDKIRSQNEWRRDIGAAQAYIDTLLQLVGGDHVKCNVILMTHIIFAKGDGTLPKENEIDPETGQAPELIGFPETIGRSQTKHIGKLFNDVLLVKKTGNSAVIQTKTVGTIRLKNSAPTKVKTSYPQETGLASYFKDVRGE